MPQNNQSTDPHVAVLAFPFSTHAAPLLAVIRRLAAAAPTVQFSFFNTAKSNGSIFSGSEPSNIKAYDVADGVPHNYVFLGKHQEDIELFLKAAPENFRKGLGEAVKETGRGVSCLVADGFFWFSAEMAAELGVAWVPFWTAGPNSLTTHVYTDLIRETVGVGGIIGREDETLSFIPGMSKIRIRDLPEGIIFGNLNSPFSCMLHRMGQTLPEAEAVFINCFQELDLTLTDNLKSKFKKFLNIGPFNMIMPPPPIPDKTGCLSWLDKQKPESVAYISFGTVTSPPPNELIAIAEALIESGFSFLWALRDDLKARLPNEFTEKIRENGKLVSWTPQVEVLGHSSVGVFVTHCGWNSLLESIAGGVPMICRPFFGDQRLNGRMIEDVWKIGAIVNGGIFTKDGIMSNLNKILVNEEGKEMRKRIRDLKEHAEKAVGGKGSSTENFRSLFDIVTRNNGA